MTMRGIDVSSWNGNPFNAATELAYGQSGFLIAKTTQGTGYANPHAGYAIGRAIADGKLWGFYHYAGGGDPKAEADWFVEKSKGYFGRGVPVLDWEGEQNAAWGSTTWCRAFAERVHERTGVWCVLYTGLDGCRHAASCADVCALWFAGYPVNAASWDVPRFPYSIPAPWKGWAIWQFTSGGGVDRNTTELDAAAWLRIAKGDKAEPKGPSRSVQLYRSNGTPAQVFEAEWRDAEWFALRNAACGLYLDVAQGKGAKGTPVRLHPGNGTDAQMWRAVPATGAYRPAQGAPLVLSPKCAPGMVLDAKGGRDADGTGVQLWKPNGTAAQQWALLDMGGGKWTLLSMMGAHRALDAKDGGR